MSEQGRAPETPAAVPPAAFCNVAQISHTNHEFFLEFGQFSPQIDQSGKPRSPVQVQLVARLAMTPQHAKDLLRALEENVSRYEAMHGAIVSRPLKATGTVQ
jgi:Protein of unknown function (DUF3467)